MTLERVWHAFVSNNDTIQQSVKIQSKSIYKISAHSSQTPKDCLFLDTQDPTQGYTLIL